MSLPVPFVVFQCDQVYTIFFIVNLLQVEKKRTGAEGVMLDGRTHVDSLTSSWDRQPSVEELLTSIVQLWSELQVPLRERSQFWLAHQGKDLFYFRAEYGHLLEFQQYVSNSCWNIKVGMGYSHCRRCLVTSFF